METTEKKQYRVEWVPGSKGAFYALRIDQETGHCVECSCPDRVYRGRDSGRACKHMLKHNTEAVARIQRAGDRGAGGQAQREQGRVAVLSAMREARGLVKIA